MRWLLAIQSVIFVCLLIASGFCLTYGKPEKFAQLQDSEAVRVEGQFLKKIEIVAPECAGSIKSLLESRSAAFEAIQADHKLILGVGEMLLWLSLFQLAAIVLSAKIKRQKNAA